jgi:hypothetical protein
MAYPIARSRSVLNICVPVFLAFTLAACGGDGSDSQGANAAAGGGGAPSVPSPAPPAPPPAAPPTIAITARGTAVGPIDAWVVPATGGSLVSADGRLTVKVPPGALPAMTKISIQAIDNHSPGGRGMGYRLLPEGLTFTAPVTLSFRYDDADIGGSEPLALRVAYQDAAGRWNSIRQRTIDEATRTLSIETTHFSDWSMLAGWQLSPAATQVSAGLAVDFKVVACVTKEGPNSELADLAYTCVPEPEYFQVEDWQANGIDGGTLVDGQIASSSPGTARYVAPNVAPKGDKNPVNVSARAKDKSGRTRLLIASVWVGDLPPLAGTVTSTQITTGGGITVTHSTTARVVFKHDLDSGLYLVNSGTVASRIDTVQAAVCESHIAWSGAINPADPTTGQRDGAIAMQEDGRYTADALTMAPHSGTTNCTSDGRTESITVPTAGALWFPAPPAIISGLVDSKDLKRKTHGVLEESFTWWPGADSPGKGREITVMWRLSPVR